MTQREDYRFSVTVYTDDLAVVNCLRALSQYSQETENNRIPWGGAMDRDWKRDGHTVTFRVSQPSYREGFIIEIERLLPKALWIERRRSDKDPPNLGSYTLLN
jgi:hypothetical protein